MNTNFSTGRDSRPRKLASPLPFFTLVELLTVVAVITILAAMLVPAVNTVRTRARTATTASEIRGLETAMTAYYQDYAVYPNDRYGSGEHARRAGQALFYSLDYGDYFEFDANRVTRGEIHGDSGDEYVFLNPFPGDEVYYRFQTNDGNSKDDPDSFWTECDERDPDDPGGLHYEHRVHVNRNSVDIWTADDLDRDFYDRLQDDGVIEACDEHVDEHPWPTWENIRDYDIEYHTIGNW